MEISNDFWENEEFQVTTIDTSFLVWDKTSEWISICSVCQQDHFIWDPENSALDTSLELVTCLLSPTEAWMKRRNQWSVPMHISICKISQDLMRKPDLENQLA